VDAADVPLQRLVLPLVALCGRGTHVCLRWVRAKAMYDSIVEHGVTHLCGAPIVMSTLLNAPRAEKAHHPAGRGVQSPPPPRRRGGAADMADAGFKSPISMA
jgi:fatty-acyl-CoA synthase